ncbi:MAG: haloacid dehalogenase type II [Salinirussus sp.]
MSLEIDRVDVVTFDSFSTLVDVESTARPLEGVVDDPVTFARDWHSRAAFYGIVANHLDHYETYYDFHRLALEYLLAERDIAATPTELDEITSIYYDMTPFPDVRPGMEHLSEAGYALGIVSNGDPEMLDSLVETLGIADLLSGVISADAVKRYKPARQLYEYAADRLETEPAAMLHVANGSVDIMGAKHTGLQAAWLNRTETPPEPWGPEPDITIDDITGLAERLE